MGSSRSLLGCLSSYVETAGSHLTGRQALARWAVSQTRLRRYRTLGEVVRSARAAPSTEQDKLLGALIAAAGAEPLAQLAVIAALSRHLGSAIAKWRRAGTSATDLAALEADLVSSCWEAVASAAAAMTNGSPLPKRLGLALADQAHQAVRNAFRRDLRASARTTSLDQVRGHSSSDHPPVAEQLAGEIAGAVRAGRISVSAAAPVLLTRVAGYSTAEAARALSQSPATLRAVRSRAERALVA